MSWRTKVVWSEGMLLQPQHLQQSERHADHARHLLLRSTRAHAWGFAELELDTAALALGKLALTRAVGVFGDGTPFDMPAVDPLPEALDIPEGLRDEAIVLALPLRRAGAREADAEAYEDLVRHRVLEVEVPDSNTSGDRSAMLQLGALHTRLMRAGDATDAWTTLRVARVTERRVDNQVLLDRAVVPPLLDVAAHPLPRGWLDELLGLLRQRGDELAGSLTAGGTGGVAEIADFLMLQTVNRNEAVFAHLAKTATLHPQHFFEHTLSLAGDLITFRDSRRTTRFGPYVHDDLALSFKPVMDDLRRSFAMVIDRAAIRIELHERKNNVHVAVVKDTELQRKAIFVRVNRDGPQPQLGGRAENTDSDLTAIGDE